MAHEHAEGHSGGAQDTADTDARDDGHESVRERASSTLSTARHEASERTREVSEWLRAQGKAIVHAQLDRAASEFEGLSEAGQAAARKLHDTGDDRIAGYTEAFADNLSAAGRYLRESSISEIYQDLEEFGRRRPELLIGGLFVGGLALARFLRASRERSPEPEWESRELEDPERNAATSSTGGEAPPPRPQSTGEGS